MLRNESRVRAKERELRQKAKDVRASGRNAKARIIRAMADGMRLAIRELCGTKTEWQKQQDRLNKREKYRIAKKQRAMP